MFMIVCNPGNCLGVNVNQLLDHATTQQNYSDVQKANKDYFLLVQVTENWNSTKMTFT